MRSAPADQAFWGKSGSQADAGWLDDLAATDTAPGVAAPSDASSDELAEAHGLDDVAAARRMPVDPIFDELREMASPAPAGVTLAGGPPRDAATPATSASEGPPPTTEFDWTGVSDDLLPSWKLDL